MSRKWLEKEGIRWVGEGILSEEQMNRILSLYPEGTRAMRLLPVFASVLIGLGILTFVASNWSAISNGWKLIILIVCMLSFYITGDRLNRNGSAVGIPLIGLGVISFGASIVLTGQMYQMVSYDARVFLFWLLPALFFTYYYESRLLYVLSTVIAAAGQFYSMAAYQSFSLWLGLLAVLGLGWFVIKSRMLLVSALYAILLLVQGICLTTMAELNGLWFVVPLVILYLLGDLFYRLEKIGPVFHVVSLAGGFLFSYLMTLEARQYILQKPEGVLYFLIIWALSFLISCWVKQRQGRLATTFEWLLFLPIFQTVAPGPDTWDWIGAVYILVLFLFSGYLLWQGFAEEWRLKVNFGTAAFLFSSFVAYVNLAWDFMPKSLLFLLGGILLFVLNYVLQRKKRQLFSGRKEEKK